MHFPLRRHQFHIAMFVYQCPIAAMSTRKVHEIVHSYPCDCKCARDSTHERTSCNVCALRTRPDAFDVAAVIQSAFTFYSQLCI